MTRFIRYNSTVLYVDVSRLIGTAVYRCGNAELANPVTTALPWFGQKI